MTQVRATKRPAGPEPRLSRTAAAEPAVLRTRVTRKTIAPGPAKSGSTSRRGVPPARVRYGITQEEFADLTGMSKSVVSQIENNRKPAVTPGDRRRIREVERLCTEIAKIIRPAAVGAWLRSPNPRFHDSSPLEIIRRGEMDRVLRLAWHLQDNAGG